MQIDCLETGLWSAVFSTIVRVAINVYWAQCANDTVEWFAIYIRIIQCTNIYLPFIEITLLIP